MVGRMIAIPQLRENTLDSWLTSDVPEDSPQREASRLESFFDDLLFLEPQELADVLTG